MVVSAQGIDVSGFQPPLNDQTLSGLSFAFCKASEGLSIIDPYLSWNWQAIKSAGKVRGAYHELTAADSAIEQASFFVNTVRPHGVRPGDMFAIVAGGRSVVTGNHPGITSAMIQTCCELVSELVGPQCPVLVYADSSMARSLTTCTGFPLWIACAGTPPVDVRPWNAWRFWQCSARPSHQDMYNGTAEDLDTWICGYTSGAPSPPVAAQPPASWQEEMMKSLPTLDLGAHDAPDAWMVSRVQALCTALGAPCPIDGDFGPETQNAVRAVQQQFGLTRDGIVGPLTWLALVTD
jgi:peptidoglycan hydrolase-like protein with peptidoglycan-binding domain